jgi:hypothetical protein
MTTSDRFSTIAYNMQRVYLSGYNKGYEEGEQLGHQEGTAEGWQQGLDEGINIGKTEQYDNFWDIFQQNGNRTNYEYAFAGGKTWSDSIFKPKYSFKPQYAAYMFTQCGIIDLKSCLAEKELTLDFSNTANLLSAFAWNDSMVAIGKFKVSSTTTNYASTFAGCNNLKDIEFEGEIVSNLDISASKVLSKASITSLINTLSTSTSGKTVTLSKVAVNTAFETSAGAGDGEASTRWISLEQSRSNWTISLV